VSLIFADQAKPNVAGANGQQFPREVRLINKIDAVTEQLPDQH
jgi:hypothetical protein